MRHFSTRWAGLLTVGVCLGTAGQCRAQAEIAHLPVAIQGDIMAWRARLESAECLKVVAELEDTWERMHELDERGDPVVARHERFQAHAWMTPDMLWLVFFAYEGDEVDTETPRSQILWERESGLVRERYWDEQEQVYRFLRYTEDRPFGPANAHFETKACTYGMVMESWLAGGPLLEDRGITVRSAALMRKPNLAIVPPEDQLPGVWLDVFSEDYRRDNHEDEGRMYRRQDFMLLSRDELGEPVVSEHWTVVMTDPDDGGATPTQIYARFRCTYTFYGAIPGELVTSTETFSQDFDAVALPSSGTGESDADE